MATRKKKARGARVSTPSPPLEHEQRLANARRNLRKDRQRLIADHEFPKNFALTKELGPLIADYVLASDPAFRSNKSAMRGWLTQVIDATEDFAKTPTKPQRHKLEQVRRDARALRRLLAMGAAKHNLLLTDATWASTENAGKARSGEFLKTDEEEAEDELLSNFADWLRKIDPAITWTPFSQQALRAAVNGSSIIRARAIAARQALPRYSSGRENQALNEFITGLANIYERIPQKNLRLTTNPFSGVVTGAFLRFVHHCCSIAGIVPAALDDAVKNQTRLRKKTLKSGA